MIDSFRSSGEMHKKDKNYLSKKKIRFKNMKNGFGLLTHRTFKIIWFSNFLTLSVTWWRLLQKHIVHTKFDIYVFIIKLIIRIMETHWLILLHTIPLITTHSLHNHTSMTNKSKSWVKNIFHRQRSMVMCSQCI